MAAKMEKTRTPGVYKRGGRYVVVFRDQDGHQRKESARTYDEARKLKGARAADVARGEFEPLARVRLHDYAREWIERYTGTRRRGFRDETRDEWRRLLDRFALRYFPASKLLGALTAAVEPSGGLSRTRPERRNGYPSRRSRVRDPSSASPAGPGWAT
jgi:hypothetical protein